MDENHLDCIHIRDLVCRCIVGINPEERVKRQEVLINVTMWADLRDACASDDIADTVDYKKVKEGILAMVEASSYNLVERLASEIAAVCLQASRVRRVRVVLDKPGALRFARSVAVDLTRERGEV